MKEKLHFTCVAGTFLDELHLDLCVKWQQNNSKREVDEKSSKDGGVKGEELAGLSQPYMGVVGSQKKEESIRCCQIWSALIESTTTEGQPVSGKEY